jgi:hypothetical protein
MTGGKMAENGKRKRGFRTGKNKKFNAPIIGPVIVINFGAVPQKADAFRFSKG